MLPVTEVYGKTVKVNGTEIYYEIRGEGPTILFISGATGDANSFDRVAALLAGEFTVVTYDRRGNSRSPRPAGWDKTSAGEQACDAAGLLKALGRTPAFVYGNSSGAIIALNLLIRYPELLRGALLHEPPLISVLARPEAVTAPLQAVLDAEMAAGGPRRAIQAFLRFAVGDAILEKMDPGLRERKLGNAETFFGMEFGVFESYRPDEASLASLIAPVQILVGKESAAFYNEAAQWLAKRMNGEISYLPGGHTPQYDRPQVVAETIRSCVRRWSRS
jgi:pimeloyl-ACP methyl ester carboxylesterase